MRFGTVPLAEAGGLISAHTVRRADITLRKGAVIGPEEAAGLARTGLSEIVVAALEPGDVGEDDAAARLAGCLRGRTCVSSRRSPAAATCSPRGPGC